MKIFCHGLTQTCPPPARHRKASAEAVGPGASGEAGGPGASGEAGGPVRNKM